MKTNKKSQTVQEAVATTVEDMLAECPSPSVLRAATVSLFGTKHGENGRGGTWGGVASSDGIKRAEATYVALRVS